ncbi:MAG: FAD-dependent oxidoreductase [Pseudomonadota bacterium]
MTFTNLARPLNIAVIGSGISGMSAAWLLSQNHNVVVYEKGDYIGGHTNTVDAHLKSGVVPVDTGFIVYNPPNYPNFTALLNHLGVENVETCMSFSASIDDGAIEYSGQGVSAMCAKATNVLRPRFWRMLCDLVRFYKSAQKFADDPAYEHYTLGRFLDEKGYSKDFLYDHLLPMAAAIWSMPVEDALDYPLGAFVRFYANHGLLKLANQPIWNTVANGSRSYVSEITKPYADNILLNTGVEAVSRSADGVAVHDRQGGVRIFDHIVIASHADEALSMLSDADDRERDLLGAFRYQRNKAILHTDEGFMPEARRAWASWNYMSTRAGDQREVCVTYWMNRLQNLDCPEDVFVTLNTFRPPREGTVLRTFLYDHPIFDLAAVKAQKDLWDIQGVRRTWFCGSYFGHGFHEDGLQSGLAVAEALGGARRPWTVENESGRIHLPSPVAQAAE